MSILRYKQKVMFADGGVLRDSGGGGGGGGQPTQSTSYNTNVPEYARPYVENMLQSTQKQIYNDDMTSFRPYTPYSTDVNNYFAGFSPLQQQAQSETANMQQPGQYGAATGLTGLGTMGALGIAGQAAGAGGQYNQMATDPRSMQGFMSPYMQNVVDYQKSQAIRDYGIGQQGLRAQASRSGAFGGSRQAIQEAEAQRSLGSQLQGIEATGAQQAFQNAQQAQQFGANLGLQGYQTGLQGLNTSLQGAGQLASIGSQQQAADLARLQAQQQVGAQQQTMEQNKINQAISNYATAQQYPFMQLGIMNSMLRGLPLQQTTTASYQQQPSTAQQLTGLGGAALSYLGKKEGGVIEMKEGGTVPGYKYGDLISDPQLQGMSQNLSPQQLQGRIADQQVTPNERGIFQGTQQAQNRMASNPMAAQQMAQMSAPPPQMAQAPSDDARMGGIAQAGGDMFNTMGYAGGGIIAFADGGALTKEQVEQMLTRGSIRRSDEEIKKALEEQSDFGMSPRTKAARDRERSALAMASVNAPKTTVAQAQQQDMENNAPGTPPVMAAAPSTYKNPTAPTSDTARTVVKSETKEAAMSPREAMYAQTQAMLEKQGFKPGATDEEKAYADMITRQQAGLGDATSAKERANMAKAFLKMGANPRGFLAGAIEGGESYLTGAGEIAAGKETREMALAEARAKYAAAQRARAVGDMAASDKLTQEAAQLENQANIAARNNATAIQAAQIHAGPAGQAGRQEEAKVEAYMKDHPNTTRSEAYAAVAQYSRGESNEITRLKAAIELKQRQLFGKNTDAQRAKIEQEIATLTQQLLQSGAKPADGTPGPAEAPVTSKTEYDKLPKGAHYVAPNGKTYIKS
jgi:hypothetical protein